MTIYALSTGPGISGIAVIRVSGKNTAEVIKKITGAKNLETLLALREGFRQGIPNINVDYAPSIRKAFKILADIGGKKLVGDSKALAEGVLWRK